VDVGSRLDGFVAHVLPFCHLTYVDLRSLELEHSNFAYRQGSILDLTFASGSINSLSCLHVIEHIGLGRYGDPVDPDGHIKAAAELLRVLAPGGRLLLGTPVGRERLCFDAHRVFSPETVVKMFSSARLVEFHLVPDDGTRIVRNAPFALASACNYGCGLFVFTRDL
jgi:SAM-dependent methyltransferase